MASIGRLWAGRVYGTNTGNLFAELQASPSGLSGTLRFMDSSFGLVIYHVEGTFDGSALVLEGDVQQAAPGTEAGRITANAVLTPQGYLNGQWSSSLGTAGTFELFPHDLRADQSKVSGSSVPEQLHTARLGIGAVRLYADDVRELVQVIRKDFTVGRLIVTYKSAGVENTRYIEDFERDAPRLDELQYLKLFIQEPEAHGISKLAMIELNAWGSNDVMVQGIYESWVIGKAEALSREIRRYEKSLVTNTKKFGLGLNQLIAVTMLVLFPEVEPLWRRAAFALVVVGLLAGLVWVHSRYLPNLVVYMSPRKPGTIARAWPTILSWLIAATASLAAAYAFYLLTKGAPT